MRVFAVVLILVITVGAGPAPAGIDRVAWLTGCWLMENGSTIVEEQWMAPRGGTMLGMSRTVRDERTVAYETTLVRARGDTLAYEAHPGGQPSAVFLATEVGDSDVVFANPEHDFPQRILYRRRGDSLIARVEGKRNGKVRGLDFPYRATACASDPAAAGDGRR